MKLISRILSGLGILIVILSILTPWCITNILTINGSTIVFTDTLRPITIGKSLSMLITFIPLLLGLLLLIVGFIRKKISWIFLSSIFIYLSVIIFVIAIEIFLLPEVLDKTVQLESIYHTDLRPVIIITSGPILTVLASILLTSVIIIENLTR